MKLSNILFIEKDKTSMIEVIEALLAALLFSTLYHLYSNPQLVVGILKPVGNIIALP